MKQVELVPVMGTVVSIDVRTPVRPEGFREAVEAVAGRLREIDDMFSPWQRDSWVSRLISGVLVPEDCPLEVQRVVELSLQMMGLTDGFFSPYWRRGPHGDAGPDPTGLVKGWAAQQASDLLVALSLPDHAVNAAGDVVVSGRSAPGDPGCAWHIGISDPHHDRSLAGVLNLDQSAARWAVATSGTAEVGAHVGDPHTGRFPCSVASATAVTRIEGCEAGAAVADACATALVAAGEGAQVLQEGLTGQGMEFLLIDRDGSLHDPRGMLTPA